MSERARVHSALLGFGYDAPGDRGQLRLAAAGRAAATAWAAACADRKLIVRPFAGDGVRVTIGTAEENDRLLEAARELADHPG